MSGLLLVLAVEILSVAIRASGDIKGIQIANREIKLSQYADDTTVFCKDIFSLEKLLDLLSTFCDCSGLKLNVTKSEAMWLGKTANRKDMPFDVKWLRRSIYSLRTAFSYNRNLCETENFTSKINKFQKLFNIWSQRDLSLYGRKLITKTLGLSKLIYSSAQVPDIVNKLVVNYSWAPFLRFGVTFAHANLCLHTFIKRSLGWEGGRVLFEIFSSSCKNSFVVLGKCEERFKRGNVVLKCI